MWRPSIIVEMGTLSPDALLAPKACMAKALIDKLVFDDMRDAVGK